MDTVALVGYFVFLIVAAVLALVGLAIALRCSLLPRAVRCHRARPLRTGEVIGWLMWTVAFAPVVAGPLLDWFVNAALSSTDLADAVASIQPRNTAIWVIFTCGLLSGTAIIALGRRFDRHPEASA